MTADRAQNLPREAPHYEAGAENDYDILQNVEPEGPPARIVELFVEPIAEAVEVDLQVAEVRADSAQLVGQVFERFGTRIAAVLLDNVLAQRDQGLQLADEGLKRRRITQGVEKAPQVFGARIAQGAGTGGRPA